MSILAFPTERELAPGTRATSAAPLWAARVPLGSGAGAVRPGGSEAGASGGVGLTEALLERAVALRASDLHLDPQPECYRARLRVDGRFLPPLPVPLDAARRLIGRLKVLAELLVYRCDVPQEGRMVLPSGHEARVAVLPTPLGEKVTVRLFDPGTSLGALDDLGLPEAARRWLRARLRQPDGLLLVVGPSGSGKTTTLYACLQEILSSRGDFAQVVTVEDPVERQLPGCVQVQVDPVRDLDFAAALRFLLRQDPEVVLIGEVRDAETARIAVRAAMTGHLVLSSLHASRAAEARPRLLEMGVERYAVDLALRGVLSQRLVRTVCKACGGAGCEPCGGTGTHGRLPAVELLTAGAEAPELRLEESVDGLVASGLTSEDERRRVLGGE